LGLGTRRQRPVFHQIVIRTFTGEAPPNGRRPSAPSGPGGREKNLARRGRDSSGLPDSFAKQPPGRNAVGADAVGFAPTDQSRRLSARLGPSATSITGDGYDARRMRRKRRSDMPSYPAASRLEIVPIPTQSNEAPSSAGRLAFMFLHASPLASNGDTFAAFGETTFKRTPSYAPSRQPRAAILRSTPAPEGSSPVWQVFDAVALQLRRTTAQPANRRRRPAAGVVCIRRSPCGERHSRYAELGMVPGNRPRWKGTCRDNHPYEAVRASLPAFRIALP